MKPVTPPNWDAREDYEAIVQRKQGALQGRLSSLGQLVRRSYARYQERAQAQALNQQHPATSVDADYGEDLRHCYDIATAPMRALRRRLENLLDKRRCPYCGFGTAETLDHYLPKSYFPELSVCAYNLIPCCHRCNLVRGNHDWRPGHRPAVIHVFYEPIDVENGHLQADFAIKDDGITVVFSVVADNRTPFSVRFQRHFEALDLADRLSSQATDELSELISDLGGALDSCPETDLERLVRDTTACKAASRKCKYGANHWKAAFYHAAAESHEVTKFILRRVGVP